MKKEREIEKEKQNIERYEEAIKYLDCKEFNYDEHMKSFFVTLIVSLVFTYLYLSVGSLIIKIASFVLGALSSYTCILFGASCFLDTMGEKNNINSSLESDEKRKEEFEGKIKESQRKIELLSKKELDEKPTKSKTLIEENMTILDSTIKIAIELSYNCDQLDDYNSKMFDNELNAFVINYTKGIYELNKSNDLDALSKFKEEAKEELKKINGRINIAIADKNKPNDELNSSKNKEMTRVL